MIYIIPPVFLIEARPASGLCNFRRSVHAAGTCISIPGASPFNQGIPPPFSGDSCPDFRLPGGTCANRIPRGGMLP